MFVVFTAGVLGTWLVQQGHRGHAHPPQLGAARAGGRAVRAPSLVYLEKVLPEAGGCSYRVPWGSGCATAAPQVCTATAGLCCMRWRFWNLPASVFLDEADSPVACQRGPRGEERLTLQVIDSPLAWNTK